MSSAAGFLLRLSPALVSGLFLGALLASGHPFFGDEEGGHGDGNHFNPLNPWEPFYNLSGCRRGEARPGLADVKRYLHQFGYLPDQSSDFSGDFDDALEEAILAYQRRFNLDTTGSLDNSTIDLMVQPRCGVADVDGDTAAATSRGRGLYAYFSGRPKWPSYQTHLTYTFASMSGITASSSAVRAIFDRAFSRWSNVTTLTFSEADDGAQGADITIGFYSGDHGDGEPFDGVLGTLAHAFSPPDGRFHLDAAENWVVQGDVTAATSLAAVDLESVAVHEIGHLLGLGHSAVPDSIMYPSLRVGTRKVDLAQDDVDGIQSLYGTNPAYTGPQARSTRTSTMTERDTSGSAGDLRRAGWAPAIAVAGIAVAVHLLAW